MFTPSPVYTINNSRTPTKVVPKGGDLKQVFPSGVDFGRFRDFAVLPDGSHVGRKFAQQGVPIVPDGLPKQLLWGTVR